MSLFWSHRNRSIIGAIDSLSDAVDNAGILSPSLDSTNPRESSDANERLDQLLLVCAAMWELLSEKTSLTENDLITRIAEIDARDGAADGKITHTPIKCPKCQRTIFPKHRRCLYCGADIPVDSVFKTI